MRLLRFARNDAMYVIAREKLPKQSAVGQNEMLQAFRVRMTIHLSMGGTANQHFFADIVLRGH